MNRIRNKCHAVGDHTAYNLSNADAKVKKKSKPQFGNGLV
jgi:hypothetical protein